LQVVRVPREALATVVRLGQAVALDHRAHRPVEDEDAAAEQLVQGAGDVGRSHGALSLRAKAVTIWKCGWRCSREVVPQGAAVDRACASRRLTVPGLKPACTWP